MVNGLICRAYNHISIAVCLYHCKPQAKADSPLRCHPSSNNALADPTTSGGNKLQYTAQIYHQGQRQSYGSGVPIFLRNAGVQEVRTAFKSPWQNPYVERVVGTLRRELLNHIIPLNEQHLHKLLREYIGSYYHLVRTHSSLAHRPPLALLDGKKQQLSPDTEIESKPILGGLYHSYKAKAA
jgi:transposase InsO family protein